MALGERGNFEEPRKSAWNFEVYDSRLERRMMERSKATRRSASGRSATASRIGWVDPRHYRHNYRPDFLVEYTDGSLAADRG